MKEPMTEDLLNELLDSPDPAAFASKHKLACRSLPDYLQQLLDERSLRRPEVVRQAGINPTFGYQIFVMNPQGGHGSFACGRLRSIVCVRVAGHGLSDSVARRHSADREAVPVA